MANTQDWILEIQAEAERKTLERIKADTDEQKRAESEDKQETASPEKKKA